MDGSTVRLLDALAKDAGVRYEYDNWGNSRLVVPQDAAEKKLKDIKEDYLASVLMIAMDSNGGGVRQLLDNMASILDSLPEDENKRAKITEILDELMEGVLSTTGHLSGELSQRIGNEIMID